MSESIPCRFLILLLSFSLRRRPGKGLIDEWIRVQSVWIFFLFSESDMVTLLPREKD